MNPTLYDVLGVPRDASADAIKQAWKESAERFDPGSGGSPAQFRLFNEAAEVLLDPARRKAYDAQLEAQGADSEDVVAGPEKNGASHNGTRTGAGPVPVPATAVEEPVTAPIPGAATATVTATAPRPGDDGPVELPPETGPVPEGAVGSAADRAEEPAGRRVPWVVLAVLGVLAAVTVGLAAYVTFEARDAKGQLAAVERAPAAAERAAAAVLSYGHESLDSDRDAAARFLTPKYRKEYVKTFDSLVKENATKTKATVEAEVLASSVMPTGGSADRVRVLLFVNQTTTSEAKPGDPSVALNRVRFDMVKVGDSWLVDAITSY